MSCNQGAKHFARLGVALTMVLLVASCAMVQTTSMTSSWKDPRYNLGPLNKVAVFVVHEDVSVRRLAEDQVVAHMPAGTEAVASYTLIEKLEEGAREQIRARLIEEGFDGALVIRLVDISTHETYVPPHTYIDPGNPNYGGVPYYSSFGNYYGYVYGQVYTVPAYVRKDTIAKMETILYTLPDSKMVWSGISERVNPESAQSVAHELAELISNELVGQGIVGRARTNR